MSRLEERACSLTEPPYLIAEIGANHCGSMETARRLVDAAAAAGADCVKGQKRCLDVMSPEQRDRPYDSEHAYGRTYGEHRAALELTLDQHLELARYARTQGLDYALSFWDRVSLVESLVDPFAFVKVPSALATNLDVLAEAAASCAVSEVPLVLSTGMCSDEDVDLASRAIVEHAPSAYLMHCTSAYPLDAGDADLLVVRSFADHYVPPYRAVGISGHWRGIQLDAAAVALGARIVERHLTLDRTMKGTDHAASLEPGAFAKLARDLAEVTRALGDGRKKFRDCERAAARKLRG